MMVFADTNWLEAMYFPAIQGRPEAVGRAATVSRYIRRIGAPIVVSQIVLLEARNVFGRISGEKKPAAWDRLRSDLGGRIRLDPFDWPALRDETNRLLELFCHNASIGTFDTTLVASARLAAATELLSFDEQIKVLATCVGLRVFPELSEAGKARVAALRAA